MYEITDLFLAGVVSWIGDQESDELPLGHPLEHLRALLLRSTLVLSSVRHTVKHFFQTVSRECVQFHFGPGKWD
jgi:hypothetical protein